MMDTLNYLFKIFLGSFAILFFIGLISGQNDRKQMGLAVAIQHITLHEHLDTAYLAFSCNDKITHLYDTDVNALIRNPSQLAAVSLLQ